MKPTMKYCLLCGKQFITTNTRGKYCSLKCGYLFRWKREKTHFCSSCGALISLRNESRLCRTCFMGSITKEPYVKICKFCGKEFYTKSKQTKFCSIRCFGGWLSSKASKRKVSDKHRKMALLWDKDWLEYQFVTLKRSGEDIAKEVGTSNRTVCYWLKSFNIGGFTEKKRITSRWNEGDKKNVQGTICIRINGKWYPEHRYIIEKEIGRKLTNKESVHHHNGNHLDNRRENLTVLSYRDHYIRSNYCSQCPLRKENKLLQEKIALLL